MRHYVRQMTRIFVAGLSLLVSAAMLQANLKDGLVAYYPLDEPPDSLDIKDASGRGHDGKTNASPDENGVETTQTVSVVAGKGIRFPDRPAVVTQPVKAVVIFKGGEETELQAGSDFEATQDGIKLLRGDIPVGSQIRLTYHSYNEGLLREAGMKGSALGFDGINDRASAPLDQTTDFSNGLTIAAWINPGKRRSPIEIVFNVAGGCGLSFYGDTLAFRYAGLFESTSEHGNLAFEHFQRPVDQWTHIAVVTNGTDVRLYVNGVETDVKSGLLYGMIPNPTVGEIRLGGINTYNYKGLLDEVRLYNRPLSAEEIATLAKP